MNRGVKTVIFIGVSVAVILLAAWLFHLSQDDGICRNEALVKLLSEEEDDADFVFLGNHYCLPCPLSDFMDNGFLPADEDQRKQLQKATLEKGQWQRVYLRFGKSSMMKLIVFQPEDRKIQLQEAEVCSAEVFFSLADELLVKEDCFVSKYGFTGRTTRAAFREYFGEDALYLQENCCHYISSDHLSYSALETKDYPELKLITVTYSDTQISGWNSIRISSMGYSVPHDDKVAYFEDYRNDLRLPEIILTYSEE